MSQQWMARTVTCLGMAGICSGCVPFLTTAYVADPTPGTPIYESCSLNSSVPVGVALEVKGVRANVSLIRNNEGGFVEVRFDVPVGTILVLEDDVLKVDRRSGQKVERAKIPNISLADRAIFSSYHPSPALEKYMVPVGTPLVGSDRVIIERHRGLHFWVAARADIDANDVWVTLPSFTINGVSVDVAELHFHRKRIFAIAPLNC